MSAEATPLTDCAFASKYMSEAIPELVLPDQGAAADVVYQVIKDMRYEEKGKKERIYRRED